MIADELGFAALAVDMYGEGKTVSTAAEAQALATPFYKNPMLGVDRLRKFAGAAESSAKQSGFEINTSKIASIGFCFGGSQSLNLARAGGLGDAGKLLGVVSFHGGLASALKAEKPITAKLLVLHGAADQFVKPEEVAAFKTEMKADQADLTFKAYPGASHAFSNPEATEMGKKNHIPVAYQEKAAKDSWAKMKTFLTKVLK
jgi:dienelactone hydrolase